MHTQQHLLDLLIAQGVDPEAQQITLMRHKDKRYPLVKYIGTQPLNLYQGMQPRQMPVGSLLVSFFGHRSGHGLLLGVWRVEEVLPAGDAIRKGLASGSFEPLDENWKGYFHKLQETEILRDLRLKLEVEWTGRELSWRRILRSPRTHNEEQKYPISVRSEPAVPFLGFNAVSLVMSELRIALQDVMWQQSLAEFAGVYLITDERSGNQYVGSASGTRGILQRWTDYAISGHGGNKLLAKIITDAPGRELDLRFTLLEVLPSSTPRLQVLKRESYWKVVLGSRAFGLNLN